MKYAMPISYKKTCNICHTILTLRVDEIKFNGVTNVTCPTCHNPVKFTGDYGKVADGVHVDRYASNS